MQTSVADFDLLNFHNYSEYLNSFATAADHRYLQHGRVVQTIMSLGYRTKGTPLLGEREFYKRLKFVYDTINPKVTSKIFFSRYFNGTDQALQALAEREEPNILQKISTIIFLQLRQRNGFDISGYIDYEQSLRLRGLSVPGSTNWRAVFEERVLLRPKASDLSFYDWHKNQTHYSDSDNYTVIHHPSLELYFMHKGDHKYIPVTSKKSPFSENVVRTMVYSPVYGYMVLYDHLVRKKK